MKSEHRHELSENELAKWLTELPTLLRENLKTVIYVVVVAVLVSVAAYYKYYAKDLETTHEKVKITNLISRLQREKQQAMMASMSGSDKSLQLVVTANDLQSAANETKQKLPAAVAYIKRGEALRSELHYRVGIVDSQAVAAAAAEARKSYEKAIELAEGNPMLTAAAKFGIGLCAEETGHFSEAEQIYNEIVAATEFEGTVFVVQAAERLETMNDYKRPIVLAKRPAELIKVPGSSIKIQPLEMPPVETAPADTNQAG